MHYYQFNIGDYMRDTQHLDELEDLAYRRLLDLCYLSENPLPLDVKEIARRIRMRSECDRIADVLREFFTETPEGYINARAMATIETYKAKGEKAKASANARWSKNKDLANANALRTHCDGNADGMRTECASDADGMLTNNHKPITINQDQDPKDSPDSANQAAPKGKAKGSRLPAGFVVPDGWIDWALSNTAVPLADIRREALNFVDYWIAQPSGKGIKSDWLATWRNWIRKRETEQPKARGGYRAPLQSNLEAMREAAADAINTGRIDFDPDKPFG